MNEPLRKYVSNSARRGREAYVQIRVQLWRLRSCGIEPKAIWVNQDTANDMHQLWQEVTGGGRAFDGVLPSVSGVRVRVGMTGGHDYTFEYHDSRAKGEAARIAMDRVFKVQDNPLQGTH